MAQAEAVSPVATTDRDILEQYIRQGIRDIVSVPCSITDTWHSLAADAAEKGRLRLHLTNHEGNLAGIAAGIWFGTGRPALVHMQNSGIFNAGDGFVSFANPAVFGIPMAVLVTFRGWSPQDNSEPHLEIGRRTDALLASIFDGDADLFGHPSPMDPVVAVRRSMEAAKAGRQGVMKLAPTQFLRTDPPCLRAPRPIPAGDALHGLRQRKGSDSLPLAFRNQTFSRDEAIRAILAAHPEAAVLFCNGFTSRAAQAVGDRQGNFYNVGYMGGTLATGWGLAKSRPNLEVVVVDGDQNALMSSMRPHLLADYPDNLHWYVLNNHIGASVGTPCSLPLGGDFATLARVVETRPDQPGSFRHPRVTALGAYFEAGQPLTGTPTLASFARQFRHWIAQHTSGDFHEPTTSRRRPGRPSHGSQAQA